MTHSFGDDAIYEEEVLDDEDGEIDFVQNVQTKEFLQKYNISDLSIFKNP